MQYSIIAPPKTAGAYATVNGGPRHRADCLHLMCAPSKWGPGCCSVDKPLCAVKLASEEREQMEALVEIGVLF